MKKGKILYKVEGNILFDNKHKYTFGYANRKPLKKSKNNNNSNNKQFGQNPLFNIKDKHLRKKEENKENIKDNINIKTKRSTVGSYIMKKNIGPEIKRKPKLRQ